MTTGSEMSFGSFWMWLIGIAVAGISLFVAVKSARRNERNDANAVVAQNAQLISDVGYIRGGIDDLKKKQEKTDERYLQFLERITCAEKSIVQLESQFGDIQKQLERILQQQKTPTRTPRAGAGEG